jgi:CRISPR/Cas system CSM-associated protein Csm2 small subunit
LKNGIVYNNSSNTESQSLEEFFGNLNLDQEVSDNGKQSVNKTEEIDQSEFSKSSEEQKLVMDIFGECNTDFNLTDLSSLSSETQQQQSLNLLTSESAALFDEILNDKQPCMNNDWESISNDTFLPPSILKQSLGDAARGIGQKSMTNTDDKVNIRKLNPNNMNFAQLISRRSFCRKRIRLESKKVTRGWTCSQNWIHWLTIQWRIFPMIATLQLNS